MTLGDIADEVIGKYGGTALPQEDMIVAVGVLGTLAEKLKPGKGHMPLSPDEVERLRRIFAGLSRGLETALERHPSHFRPVEPGGR